MNSLGQEDCEHDDVDKFCFFLLWPSGSTFSCMLTAPNIVTKSLILPVLIK